MLAWACDPDRASSVGLDPFRLRAGVWTLLSAEQRAKAMRDAEAAIRANITFWKGIDCTSTKSRRHVSS